MTRPLLRRASTVLLAACAAVATLLLTAAPAVATEGGGGAAGASEGFGTGLWDGMLLAAPFGILVGVLVFAMSRPGEIHRDAH